LITMETCKVPEATSSKPAASKTPRASTEYSIGDPQGYTDDELVIAAQKGISPAVDELLARHRNLLYGTVRRLTVSADETDDVVQEAMLHAFVNIGQFRKEARFSSWLIAIGINSARSSRRKSRRVQWISLDETEEPFRQQQSWKLRDTRPTPEQDYFNRELHDLVRREIGNLPLPYRSVLQMCRLEQTSIEETAHELGITDAAVKSRLRRARLMLSKALVRHGHRHRFLASRTAGARV
jgi:RNA polymerase sigma-70 factor (ECF subfamily)